MRYMLLMTGTRAGVDNYRAWSDQDIQAHFAYLKNLNRELTESGEFVATEPLGLPQHAVTVRAGKDGVPVTDGIFPESKEFLLGYWIVDVENAERAYAIAAKASTAPGPGGEPLGIPIEVRQVMSGPPDSL